MADAEPKFVSHAQRALDAWDSLDSESKPEERQRVILLMVQTLRRQVVRPGTDPLLAMPFGLDDIVKACRAKGIQAADIQRVFPKVGLALEASIPSVTAALLGLEGVEDTKAAEEAAKKQADLQSKIAAASADGPSLQQVFDSQHSSIAQETVFDGDPAEEDPVEAAERRRRRREKQRQIMQFEENDG